MEPHVWNLWPKEPAATNADPSIRLTNLALSGFPELAADSILMRENQEEILSIIENSIGLLNKSFQENNAVVQKRCIAVLLEVALNFLGMERNRAGFSDGESSEVIDKIETCLQGWEHAGASDSLGAVIDQMLKGMKMVLNGKGMVAKMAEEIEKALLKDNHAASFVESSKQVIRNNVYYRIVDAGLSKFGNDSATGLRWARHLGAVQVSSNPVIAARAYEEIAELWSRFEIVASANPEWRRDPEKFGDEIALYGTVNSLLPNILDFRPIALLSNFKDGMVSIQLNPRKASDVDESVKDALKFYSILQEILQHYDSYLCGTPLEARARPNIVFKVSTSGADAISLTGNLDKMGIGTNNTVTFTVSQEINLTLVAIRGLAAALKSGIPITTIYITNMEGRLEDHLREVQAAQLLRAALDGISDKETRIGILARELGALDDVKKTGTTSEQQISILCGKKYLKSLDDEWFVRIIGTYQATLLKQMEADIRMSGIYVTRRAFQIIFSPTVKPKLVEHIKKEFGLSESEASHVVEAVDLLPASKRRAEDTYLVLGDSRVTNLTNTEFPDHQLKVLQKSRENGFNLSDFANSISAEPDQAILERLLELPDFVKAYALNSKLVKDLNEIGIIMPAESGGIEPEEWSTYGPVKKTMNEFNSAYISFKSKLVSSIAQTPIVREK